MQRELRDAAAPRRIYRYRGKRAQVLLDAQDDLCADAESCLSMLQLMEALRAYGRPHLVGSVALQLDVRLDTDIHVLVPEDLLPEAAMGAAKTIFLGRDLGVARRNEGHRGLPGSRRYLERGCVADEQAPSLGSLRSERSKRELTDEHRKVSPSLKHFYNQHYQCRYGPSRHLCRAVIDEGVRTPTQFLRCVRRAEVTYPILIRTVEQDTVEQDPLCTTASEHALIPPEPTARFLPDSGFGWLMFQMNGQRWSPSKSSCRMASLSSSSRLSS